ncbi:MAG: MarR family transcriptional regulator [Anaerolineae bacterium]
MTSDWTPYVTAQAMLDILPGFGRLIGSRIRDSGEEEATLMQVGVLMHMKDQPITTSELAKRRKVSLQSASVLVQALVERGWLSREPDPKDRRQSLLRVTPEGMVEAQARHQQMTEYIAEVLADLTPEELAAASVFIPALRRIVASHLTPDPVSDN